MRHGIARIIAILAVVMIGSIAVWELVERLLWTGPAPAAFQLVRGVTTAILMATLAAWLMARYRRGFEEILRRQSEDAHRMRLFFENIVRDAGEGIISLDREGRVRSWNRAAESIYGYTAAEMMGRTLHHLVPPDLHEERELERLDAAVARCGFVRDVETRRVRKDGAIRTVRLARSALHDGEGRVIGSTAIVRDVTARKELESRLIQAEKLAAIGQAGASIAHEVRNALAGISGAIQILRRSPLWRDLPDGFGEEVDLQVGRMARIVDDLLTYARPGPLHTQPTDLHRVLRAAMDAAGRAGEADGKTCQRQFTSDEFVSDVDPVWVEQAFRNVVLNAYQAMAPEGVLIVSSRRNDGWLEIRVTDDGPGMDAETRSRAFDPFFTTRARGTGLGLPIVRTIIEAHRGSVDLVTCPTGGTSVVLRLPPATGEHEEAEGTTMQANKLKAAGGTLAATTILALAMSAGLAADPEYVGEAKCKMCHREQHQAWADGPHARALEVLEPADREKAECLECHVTGHGKAASDTLAGVQCEACHGPGSLYKSPKLMSKSRYKADPEGAHKEALAAGLTVPDEATCRGCHNDRSPTFAGFDYAKALEQIRHWE